MNTQIKKIGNSKEIIIPSLIIKTFGLNEENLNHLCKHVIIKVSKINRLRRTFKWKLTEKS